MAKLKFDLNNEIEKELKKLMKKYECETEEALDEYLWYNFGVSLVNKITE